MAKLSTQQTLEIAFAHHQAGRLRQAEENYRHVLQRQPENAVALYGLGALYRQSGQIPQAIQLLEKAIRRTPQVAAYHAKLAECHRVAGRPAQAIECYREALRRDENMVPARSSLGTLLLETGKIDEGIEQLELTVALKPDHVSALNNLGNAHRIKGELEKAAECYRKAIAVREYAPAYSNLGGVLVEMGQVDEAIECHRKAVAAGPSSAEARFNLGAALQLRGRLPEAIEEYRKAIATTPELVQAHLNLGLGLRDSGELAAAAESYRTAIRIMPRHPEAHNGLGAVLKQQGKLDEALAEIDQAIALDADMQEAHNNRGDVLRNMGRPAEAVACFRKALAIRPDFVDAHSNLLMAMHYGPHDPEEVFQEHRKWGEGFAGEGTEARRHEGTEGKATEGKSDAATERRSDEGMEGGSDEGMEGGSDEGAIRNSQLAIGNAPNPHPDPLPAYRERGKDRKLRVGYVSPDFRQHAVAFLIRPLLEAYDRERFEVWCYSDVARPDHVTEQFRSQVTQWRDINGRLHHEVVEQIRADGIDILVDLAGHSAHNRLLVFAQKPAPIQVTQVGYPDTTGLSAIDYRVTDAHSDPPGQTESLHSEKLVRLSRTALCYWPLAESPAVGPLPAQSAGHVTFGSFNNFAKVHEGVLEVWAQILAAVSGSELAIFMPAGSCHQRIARIMEGAGVSAGRVRILPRMAYYSYLEAHNQVDILLDPFPYAGGATSFDGLWMGVPIVTMAGRTYCTRQSVGPLTNVGLGDLVTQDPAQYVRTATELALNTGRLTEIRRSLRDRMAASPLVDSKAFMRELEEAYGRM